MGKFGARVGGAGASLLAAVLLVRCTPGTEAAEDCHWIGSVNPLTGALGPVGLPLENAAKLAVQDVNRAGLVAGKPLCIATADDRTNSDRAEKLVRALIDKHDIVALNGAAASSATLNAAKAAEEVNMAIVSCCSTSPMLTKDKNVYRTVPSDALQGVALANYAKDIAGAQHVSIIYLEGVYGSALKDEFVAAFATDADHTVINAVPYQEKQSSYASLVTTALDPVPDHAILIAYPVEGAQIIRDWSTSGVARGVKWFGTDGLKDDSFALNVGSLAPEFSGTAPIPNGQKAYYDSFRDRYKAAYGGEEPGVFTSNQYDAVILIALGISAAGPTGTREQIRAAIPELSRPPGSTVDANHLADALRLVELGQDVDYSGVSGDVDLDENGDVLAGYRVWSIATSGAAIQETDRCFRCDKIQNGTSVQCSVNACQGG